MTRVKVCCIASLEEARLAVGAGAAAVGLVSTMPSGPGVIPDRRIAAIAARVPPGVASVLLTARTDPEAIVEQHRRARTNAVQLVDRLAVEARRALRDALPGISLLQVVHVGGPEAIDEAREAARAADAVLLDSGRPDAEVRELGGTGRPHDWAVSRRIVDQVEVPVFLAGGLRPENVGEAIRTVRPYGVDVCSGLRTEGYLDETELRRFLEEVRRAS